MKIYQNAFVIYLLIISTIQISIAQEYELTAFGTELVSKELIVNDYRHELNELFGLYNSNREAYTLKKVDLENKLFKHAGFSYVDIQMFKSYSDSYSFIIDFVEEKDKAERLNYRKMNTKHFDDPDNLITKWQEYQRLSFKLFKDGEINDYRCPVIHCLWAFNHPKLDPYLGFINEYALKNKEQLIKILNSCDSASYRATAPFLLAHSQLKNEDLLHALMPSIKDPDKDVRNNSMRVIYYILRTYPEIKFNVSELIDALDFPSFTDRNKALVILRSIPLDDLSKEEKSKLVAILIEILEKKDAHNYKNAYLVIKKFSKKEYAIDDIENWKNLDY
jgi:hypothetical protein